MNCKESKTKSLITTDCINEDPILLNHGYILKKVVKRKDYVNVYVAEKKGYAETYKLEEYLGKTYHAALLNYSCLKHPNLLPYHTYFKESGCTYFVSNIDRPNAKKFLKTIKLKDVKERELLVGKWARQLVSALSYCHTMGLYQVAFDSRDTVVDVDSSSLMLSAFDGMADNSSKWPLVCPETWKWPPELLHPTRRRCTLCVAKVEAWIIGHELFRLLLGCYLCCDKDPSKLSNCQIWKSVSQTLTTLPVWLESTGVSNNARSFFLSLLDPSPRIRRDLESVSNHPWLTVDVPKTVYYDFKSKSLRVITDVGKTMSATELMKLREQPSSITLEHQDIHLVKGRPKE